MFIRVVIEVLVVYPGLMEALWLPLGTMFAGLIAALAWTWWRRDRTGHRDHRPVVLKNPLQLGMALQFGLILAVVLLLSEAMKEWFGSSGIYVLSVVSGFRVHFRLPLLMLGAMIPGCVVALAMM
jgi:uncharacterized membrane protein (DUF4010 family)